MKIKTIKLLNDNTRLDLSTDDIKNLNFIYDLKPEDGGKIYGYLKLYLRSKNQCKDIELDLVEKNSHLDYFMFIDKVEFPTFPSLESICKHISDIFLLDNWKSPNADKIEQEVIRINRQMKKSSSLKSNLSFDVESDMISPTVADPSSDDIFDKIYFLDKKIVHSSNLTDDETFFLFFAMFIVMRKAMNYDMPLIIDDSLFSHLDKDEKIEFYKFISRHTKQCIIFISDHQPDETGCTNNYNSIILDNLKENGMLGSVHTPLYSDKVKKDV